MDEKIQQLQALEYNLQNLLMQKQAFELELSETQSALEEIGSSGEEVYKIIGQMMIKSDKSKILDELENKKKILDLRIKSFEKQENSLSEKIDTLREEVTKSLK